MMTTTKLSSFVATVALVVLFANPTFSQDSAKKNPNRKSRVAAAPVRPAGLYRDELGLQTRKELKDQVKDLSVQMAVMRRAKEALAGADDGTPRSAIQQNLLNLFIQMDLKESLPLAARAVEDYHIDLSLLLDSRNAEIQRLQQKAEVTQEAINELLQKIVKGEKEGYSEIKLAFLKRTIDQRLIQLDAQNLDAEGHAESAAEFQLELDRLETLNEHLNGIASDNAVLAERLLEGIERETLVEIPDTVAEGVQELNQMITLITAGEKDQKKVVKRSTVSGSPAPTVASEVDKLSTIVRLKNPERVERLLEEARNARTK